MGWFTFKRSANVSDEVNDFFEAVYDDLNGDYGEAIKDYDSAYDAWKEVFDSNIETFFMYHDDQDRFIAKGGFHWLWDAFCTHEDMKFLIDTRNPNPLQFFYIALEQMNSEFGILTINDEYKDDEIEESCRVRRPRSMRRNGRMLESRRINRNRR